MSGWRGPTAERALTLHFMCEQGLTEAGGLRHSGHDHLCEVYFLASDDLRARETPPRDRSLQRSMLKQTEEKH